jgi:hypothetical protein
MVQDTPQHWPGGREGLGDLALEAESEQGLGDAGDVGGVGGQEQIDDALAGEPWHRRAADVLGGGARPAGGDQGDQALGDLGGVRVGLMDLHRSPGVAPDRRIGSGGQGPAWSRGDLPS